FAFAEDVPLIQELPDEKAPTITSNATSSETSVPDKKNGIGIGFGVGFNYILNFDSRFSGFGNQFVFSFPLDKGMSLSIFYESDKISGKDKSGLASTTSNNIVACSLDSSLTMLRVSKEIVKYATVFLGVGTASISGTFNDSTMVTDFGVKVTPLSALNPV
ncbi:MAG: hypothetical protein HQK93_06555, partial [Nitrospirae bacterium]|nr:hypothetical protein [Nitrospirota bacterium]